MVKIDLITGFLGSGKTTFIKKYADYLIRQGCNIGILENDYGAINVDMMLLQELEGEHCELEMVSGGCCQDSDAHRRRFNILSPEANYVLASEAASAGCIVMSRTQEASEEEQQNAVAHLNRALEHAKCSRRLELEHVVRKNWEELTDADFEEIASAGYEHASYVKQDYSEHGGFESLFFMNLGMDEKALLQAVQEIFSNNACGTVFRVKGFFKDRADAWKELNMTRCRQSVQPIKRGQEVLIVIGEQLSKETIGKILKGKN